MFNWKINNHHNTKKFKDVLESFALKQHITAPTGPTHKCGHTIGLLITKEHENAFSNLEVHDPVISDHSCLSFDLDNSKPPFPREEVTYRKIKDMDLSAFHSDLKMEIAKLDMENCTVSELVDNYNTII